MSECVNFRLLSCRPILQFQRIATGLFLLGLALESSALTIGRPQGAVWIGRPMDLAIPVSLDAADADGSMCLEADMLQGDAPTPDRRVTVALEQGASGATIRVRSAVPIEEPVVTLNLRAGCNTTTQRNFTLLADIPTGNELPTAAFTVPPAASAALQAQRAANRSNAASAGGRRSAEANTTSNGEPEARRVDRKSVV